MPDTRSHRGAHPRDESLFAAGQIPILRRAVADYSWLLTGEYAEKSALKLVGDRYQLAARQRNAVMRATCSDQALHVRKAAQMAPSDCTGRHLAVDGYNLLITVESALGGGVILHGRDGCYRDLASLHGTYRSVEETMPAIGLIGEALFLLNAQEVHWLLDAPVSNSGRLRALMLEMADRMGWPWTVTLAPDVDRQLAGSQAPVATSDSWILDRVPAWTNLARHIVETQVPTAWLLDLDPAPEPERKSV